jgi:glycerol kinase
MSHEKHLLAIDQGTTSSRAMIFDQRGTALFTAQQEFTQYFPNDGWVEHDPEEIWQTTLAVCREAVAASARQGGELAAIGITNQRETTLVWDRASGEPIGRAIVWQDRRTAERCARLRREGMEEMVAAKTGLLLDPYFSGTKIGWLLDNTPGARERAERGELAFGTVDSFLLWRLTGGQVHATDATNASRTLLYNIHENCWDDDLLKLFDVPAALLPEVRDSAADFGATVPELLGKSIPIAGIAGDQQAATVGQACFTPGMIKSTYGTGCFVLINTGDTPLRSRHRLLTTIAYRVGGKTTYAIEGAIFSAGASIQWLRDGLGLIESAADSEALARSAREESGVYVVPAFTGLGAPHWDADARGAVFGLTRDTGIADLVRATLASVCYQTKDLLDAMAEDGMHPSGIRVDGGMVRNDWLVQRLADILDIPVERPVQTETTALGAAMLAGLQIGLYDSLEEIGQNWQSEARFEPIPNSEKRARRLAGWRNAVARTLSNH